VWYPPFLIRILHVAGRRKRIRPDRGNIGEKLKENMFYLPGIKRKFKLSTPVEKHVGNYPAFSPLPGRKMNGFPLLPHP
jgi:hypothetical protein